MGNQAVVERIEHVRSLIRGLAGVPQAKSAESAPDVPADETAEDEDDEAATTSVGKALFVPIQKVDKEQRTVYGIVLIPEQVDGQGDIYDADVIKKAAHNFLAKYNEATKLGVQHSIFKKGQLALVESYVSPIEFALGSRTIKAGSWIMAVKVLDDKLWKRARDGAITGFSIGGKARVLDLKPKKN